MREMKDSGITWIGEVPKDWEIGKLGSLYTQRNEKVSDKDFPPLSVTMKGIVPQLETAAKTDDGDNRKLVKKGDFAINSRSDRRGSCGISEYDGSVSLINTVLCPRSEMEPTFYNWLFHTSMFADEFYRWGHGIVNDLWTTRWQEMKSISVPLPPLSEQHLISSYLDAKCSEIDSALSLQEQMISELRAYKQSLITETVTHGLNPNAKMKNSGVEWIGEIPEGWEVRRLKKLLRLKTGTTPKNFESINEEDTLINWFTPSDVLEEGNSVISSQRKIAKRVLDDEGISLFPIGTILFVGIGASAGKVAYADAEGYSNQQITALIPENNYGKYYFYYLVAVRQQIKDNAFFTTLPIINNSYLGTVEVLCPPLSEQRSIATFLDEKCAEIDALIVLREKKMEALKEYKKSLIYECVTGKKQVI